MQLTASTHALESLRLQHQYHIKQQDFIRGRQRRAEMAQLQGVNQRSAEAREKTSPLTSQTLQPEDGVNRVKATSSTPEQLAEERILSDADNYLAYRTMAETDSLLQYLANRHYGNYSLKDLNKHKENSLRQKTMDEIIAEAVKSPKEEKTIIEELRIHNEELRKHISIILKELETCEAEKSQLAHKLEQYEHAQALYLDNVDAEEFNLPSLDLPPLEMPHFDFETVKDELSNSLEKSDSQLVTPGHISTQTP